MKRLIFIILLLLPFVVSCGLGGGTSVSNPPTIPTSNIFPDFESNIMETSVTSGPTTELLTTLPHEGESLLLTGPASSWTSTFLNGPISSSRNFRRVLTNFGKVIASTIAQQPNFELKRSPQFFTIQSQPLFGIINSWRVSISLRGDNLVRIVIRNLKDNMIYGYYLYKPKISSDPDEDGVPEKGVLAFINPETLQTNAPETLRFAALAFDFSDPDIKKMSFTMDAFDIESGIFGIFNMTHQCDVSTFKCIGQYLPIISNPPNKIFGSYAVRYGYDEVTNDVCLQTVEYNHTISLGISQFFMGPNEPMESDIINGECVNETPFWDPNIFDPEELPDRFEDDNDGGFAAALFGAGFSETPWEMVIDEMTIDDWLLGMFQ